MGRVIHFEIAADDIKRAAEFYRTVLGWEITDAGMPGGEYWLVKTGETSKPGIDGAIMPRSYSPTQAVRNTVEVDNLEEAIKQVTAAGGKVEGEIGDIPNVGRWVKAYDTEGNALGLLEPARQ